MSKARKAEFKFDEHSLEDLPIPGTDHWRGIQSDNLVRGRYYDALKDLLKVFGICAQCSSNAIWNYCGGYIKGGTECVRYCLSGHKELRSAGDYGLLPRTNARTSGPETAERGIDPASIERTQGQ